MNDQMSEVYAVQNPALGAAVIHKFVCGFYAENSNPVPFPLLFIVLPIIFREDLCLKIQSTRKNSGLSKVSEKLVEEKSSDSLFSINKTAISLRPITLHAISLAVSTKLIAVDMNTALVFPLNNGKKNKGVSVSNGIKIMLSAAEKLGYWCAKLSMIEISHWLKVRF